MVDELEAENQRLHQNNHSKPTKPVAIGGGGSNPAEVNYKYQQ